ncbi:MAG: sce7726 family protein [Pseudomonadota bacterium]
MDMATNHEIQASALARIFSASVLKELATRGRSPALARLIRECGLEIDHQSDLRIGSVFDQAFDRFRLRAHRHEYIYKAALTEKVLLGIHSLNTASMITEFRVGPCKADVVILNGTGTVYEIKSERDSLSRLSRQIDAYSKVFATVNVIVGENHLNGLKNALPDHVGILVLTDRYRVRTIRTAIDDPGRTKPDAIFDAVNQNEAARILKKAGIDVPDGPNIQRFGVMRELFKELDATTAHCHMVETLKKTRHLRPLKELLDQIPSSLFAATISASLRQKDQIKLVNALNTPIREAMTWG